MTGKPCKPISRKKLLSSFLDTVDGLGVSSQALLKGRFINDKFYYVDHYWYFSAHGFPIFRLSYDKIEYLLPYDYFASQQFGQDCIDLIRKKSRNTEAIHKATSIGQALRILTK